MTEHTAQLRPHRQLRLLAGQDAILDGQIPAQRSGRSGCSCWCSQKYPPTHRI